RFHGGVEMPAGRLAIAGEDGVDGLRGAGLALVAAGRGSTGGDQEQDQQGGLEERSHSVHLSVSGPESSRSGGVGGGGLSRPALRSASRRRNSICALTLRRSSSAQRCTASRTVGEMRRGKAFFSAMVGCSAVSTACRRSPPDGPAGRNTARPAGC